MNTEDEAAKVLWTERIQNNPKAYVDDLDGAAKCLEESELNVVLIQSDAIDTLFEKSHIPCQLVLSKVPILSRIDSKISALSSAVSLLSPVVSAMNPLLLSKSVVHVKDFFSSGLFRGMAFR